MSTEFYYDEKGIEVLLVGIESILFNTGKQIHNKQSRLTRWKNNFKKKGKIVLNEEDLIVLEQTKESNEDNDLKEYTVKNKIENDVIFTGKVLDSNNYYQMMDVFVLTSIYEGFPFVMVEAQANGLPAVVSNTISKTVNISGDVEFICLDKNEKEWADVILEKKRKYYENDVYKHICREYDLKYKVKSLEKYYEELIKE